MRLYERYHALGARRLDTKCKQCTEARKLIIYILVYDSTEEDNIQDNSYENRQQKWQGHYSRVRN